MKKIYFSLFVLFFCFFVNGQIVNIPDSIFKAKLLQANTNNSIASFQTPFNDGTTSNWVNTFNKIDSNNDGEIQVSEALLVKYLKINESNLTNVVGLEAFVNLQYLDCSDNSIVGLDVSSFTNMIYLDCRFVGVLNNLDVSGLLNLQNLNCSYNQLTSLNVSGLTSLTELDCGHNQLQNINVSSLINLKVLVCYYNQIQSLNITGLNNLTRFICNHNQLNSLNLSGLTNLNTVWCHNNQISNLNTTGLINLSYFNCSNNLITSLNFQNFTNLQYLKCIVNQIVSINVLGCTYLNTLECGANQLNNLDVSGLSNLYNLDCSINQLTFLNIKNTHSSLGPPNFSFSSNPNIQYVCADEAKISMVQARINAYNYAATCHVNSYCSFTPSGVFYTIQGNNRLDSNNNGCDTNDINYPNLKFNITSGFNSGTFISNSAGSYSIPVSSGTHNFTPQLENPTYFNISPTTTIVTFPATASPFTQNFCLTSNGIKHDLEIVIIPVNPARPGFDATYKLKYKNKGNQVESASLALNYNFLVMNLVSASSTPTPGIFGTFNWNLGTLIPFQEGEIIVTFNLNSPTESQALNAGAVLNFTSNIIGSNTDQTPNDNHSILNQTVVNSFDPNDKRCLKGTTINSGMIGEYLHYMIRFENTGTFPAQNIVVKDLIDLSKFDITTLQMTDASHICYTRINGNKVEFIFENINLDFNNAINDGYVVFKIKTLSSLSLNAQITNTANIYFDYNFPITTNTATTNFTVLQNDSFDFASYFTIYPNPAKDVLNIRSRQDIEISSITIYTVLGQIVQTIMQPSNTIDVSDLKTGNYFLKAKTDKGTSTTKFIKE